ncbi:MAG: MbnP family protein [Bacteroidota bacterium]|nr:MbnP family protein [Bacteroidota bacterium]
MKQLILLIALIVLIGCSKDTDRIQITNLSFNFEHTVGGEQLVMHPWGMCSQPAGEDCEPGHACCGEDLNYVNLAGDQYNIQTLLYVISDIYLHSADGGMQLLKKAHFVDGENPATLRFPAGELDNGSYSKISFTMGLSADRNIPGDYPDFPDGFSWPADPLGDPALTAYHYMQLEGAYDTITKMYNTHTGPLTGMDMSFNKEFDISLNVNDDLGDVAVFVNMELNNWYQNPNNISFHDYPNTMFNVDAQHELKLNGETDVFTVTTTNR